MKQWWKEHGWDVTESMKELAFIVGVPVIIALVTIVIIIFLSNPDPMKLEACKQQGLEYVSRTDSCVYRPWSKHAEK